MMARIAPILLLAVASGVSAQSVLSAHSAPKPKADLIFTHGNIYTGVVDASVLVWSGQARRGAGGALATGSSPWARATRS
jgi:hypothetical protein